MTHKETLTLALDALEDFDSLHGDKTQEAIAAIKEALAQPEQEPVAHREGFWCKDLTCKKCYSADFRFKHTTPPHRKE